MLYSLRNINNKPRCPISIAKMLFHRDLHTTNKIHNFREGGIVYGDIVIQWNSKIIYDGSSKKIHLSIGISMIDLLPSFAGNFYPSISRKRKNLYRFFVHVYPKNRYGICPVRTIVTVLADKQDIDGSRNGVVLDIFFDILRLRKDKICQAVGDSCENSQDSRKC